MSFSTGDYRKILEEFASLSDEKYKKFHEALIPGHEMTYGVRTPEVRRIAKEIIKRDPLAFLSCCEDGSYEEIMLHGFVIAGMKCPIEEKLIYVEKFLPLIQNWAICDTFCGTFKLRQKELSRMWAFLQPYFSDTREYYVRFAVVMLLGQFVTEQYIEEDLRILAAVSHEAYYVKMAAAWALSLCYIRFPQQTYALLKQQKLDKFIQNKSIQKIRESYRVPQEDKDMLNQLKIN